MTNETKKRLLDVVAACGAIGEFTAGQSFSDYESNLMLRSAVERQFEIIGEALGQAAEADASLEDAIPELPKIVSLRNRVIHGYDSVDDEIIWDIVRSKLPDLKLKVDKLLAAENG